MPSDERYPGSSGIPWAELGAPALRWESRDAWALTAILVSFLVTRGLWAYLAPHSAGYWEEAWRWVAIEELATGSSRALLDYQADHYQGGSLIAILLGRAAAAVVGVGPPALKVTALLFSGGTLTALFLVARRFFGRDVACIAALTYLCGPPLVAYWGLCLMGFHSEAALPSLAVVYASLALASGAWRTRRGWAAAGALAGLSLWFTPSTGVTVAACALAIALLRGVPRGGKLVGALIGLCAGLSPWFAYNAAHGWTGLERVLEVFGAVASPSDSFRSQGFWARAREFVIRGTGEGLLDPGGEGIGSPWRPLLFAGVLAPAGVGLLLGAVRTASAWSPRRRGDRDLASSRLELVFWLAGALFAATYLASRFTLDPRPRPISFRLFVAPAVLAVTPIAASVAHELRAGGVRRAAAGVAFASVLLCLALSTLSFAARHQADAIPLRRELGYVVFGFLSQRKYPDPIERALREVRHVAAAEDRQWAYFGIGWGTAQSCERGCSLDDMRSELERLPEPQRSGVWQGVLGGARLRIAELERDLARGPDPDLARALEQQRSILRAFSGGNRGGAASPEAPLTPSGAFRSH